ncbi:MAG: LytTR family DNA-binding domain-containing protein [Bacteroidales bacterium]|nr:LytTR family DNA-binding domain-containing protein [Bacteroidales bacterium]
MPKTVLETIIVDDEPTARDNLRYLLTQYHEIKIIDETSTVEDSYNSIQKYQPDLLFLDVELGNKNAFDLLEMIKDPITFRIIFTTGYNKYAVQAFEHAAVDYLLKPMNQERLGEAIKRVQKNINLNILMDQISKLKSCINRGKLRINIRHKNQIELINKGDIVYCEADGNYVKIFLTGNREKIVSHNLATIEDNLHEDCFIRLSRECIINAEYLVSIIKSEKKCVLQRDNNEVELSIPVRQMKNIEQKLDLI